jgi:signal transduction histidine kinase
MAATVARAPIRPAVPLQSAPGPPHRAPSPLAVTTVADWERHRLARELHDGVIQQVLAAGLAVDWCLGEVPAGSAVHEQLAMAKRLVCGAARELRSSLQGLTQHTDGNDEDLPDMLVRLLDTRATPRLRLSLHVRGAPRPLPQATRRWLCRFAGECLFNSAVHAGARHAAIRLRYAEGAVALSVADDGQGKPQTLRRIISGEVPGTGGPYHFGLTDIAAQAREMGWTLRVSRASLGGIAMEVRLPTGKVSRIGGDAGG